VRQEDGSGRWSFSVAGTRCGVVSSSPRAVRDKRGRELGCLDMSAPGPRCRGPSMERSGAASSAQSLWTTAEVMPIAELSAGCVRASSSLIGLGEATDSAVAQSVVHEDEDLAGRGDAADVATPAFSDAPEIALDL